MYVFAYLCVCMHLSRFEFVYVCAMYACICEQLYMSVVQMHMCMCICMWHVCMSLHMHLYMCGIYAYGVCISVYVSCVHIIMHA